MIVFRLVRILIRCGIVSISGSILSQDYAVNFEKCRLYSSRVALGGQAGMVCRYFLQLLKVF